MCGGAGEGRVGVAWVWVGVGEWGGGELGVSGSDWERRIKGEREG